MKEMSPLAVQLQTHKPTSSLLGRIDWVVQNSCKVVQDKGFEEQNLQVVWFDAIVSGWSIRK